MRNQLLLLEDVEDLGRSGDVVSVKPGYCRNFLLPQKKAVIADKFTLRMQAKLKEEREKRAETDRKDAQELSGKIEGMVLAIEVKVDPDGHMYGSVSATDIVRLFEKEGIVLEKRNIVLAHPIKTLGVHPIQLKLKEGVPAQITLKVHSGVELPEEQPATQEEPEKESQ
jgi:large subunit ribosomal protein L9